MRAWMIIATLIIVCGCQARNADSQTAAPKVRAASQASKPKPISASKTTQTATKKTRKNATRSKAAGRPDIKWVDKLPWQTWEDGRRRAAEEGKVLCLVVYADWCPRCRELAPVFKNPQIEALDSFESTSGEVDDTTTSPQ